MVFLESMFTPEANACYNTLKTTEQGRSIIGTLLKTRHIKNDFQKALLTLVETSMKSLGYAAFQHTRNNGIISLLTLYNPILPPIEGKTEGSLVSSLTRTPCSGNAKYDCAYEYDLAGTIVQFTDPTPNCGGSIGASPEMATYWIEESVKDLGVNQEITTPFRVPYAKK